MKNYYELLTLTLCLFSFFATAASTTNQIIHWCCLAMVAVCAFFIFDLLVVLP